jgi:hypothetical protein
MKTKHYKYMSKGELQEPICDNLSSIEIREVEEVGQ